MTRDEDEKIWTAYAKGVKQIKQAASRKPPPLPSPARQEKTPNPPAAARKVNEGKATPKPRVDLRTPLDRNIEKRLKQGDIEIEARLDLHGMRQDEAHKALTRFIAGQIKAGRRKLLIITGKGRGGNGVLRARLADWLAASPQAGHVLALRPAALKHGGAGAFYVMLRKPRKPHV